MRRKIPGTDLLIAFETAARHQSFTRAAEELSLTQSAIGRQISALENALGIQLFNRVKKRVVLSEAGQIYARQIRESLKKIEHDTMSLMAHRGTGGVLELAVIPTFATRWLIPRLSDFHHNYPAITLDLTARAEPFIFTGTPFNAAIHCGAPIWPGAVTEFLFGEELVPVCCPALLNGKDHITPDELAKLPLLHQSSRANAWNEWFSTAGCQHVNAMGGMRYELFSMLVEAAKAGLGVALVPRFFVINDELENNLLVTPHPHVLPSKHAYYLVYPEDKAGSAHLQAFCLWMREQAGIYRENTLSGSRDKSENV